MSKGNVYVHDSDSYAVGKHNCLTAPYEQLIGRSLSEAKSLLDLSRFTIDDDGELRLTSGEPVYAVSVLIENINDAHGVILSRELAEWLLDKYPTILDGKVIELMEKV